MKGRARAWLAVASLVLIAGASAWWLSRPGNSVESVSGRPASGLGASSGAPDSAAAGLEQAGRAGLAEPRDGIQREVAVLPGTDSNARAAAQQPVFGVRVRSHQGQPIPGATVTWSPLTNDVTGRYAQWSDNEFLWHLEGRNRSIEAAWAKGETDSGGVVSLAPAFDPTAGQGSVLWVSHPDFMAASRRFELTQPPLSPIEFVLEPHSGGRARVLGPDGRPVAGAEVLQQALLPLAAWPDLIDLDGHCRRALFRRHVTDAAGEVALHGISGRQSLVARHGNRSSLVVEVIEPEPIELTLAPQIEVAGNLISRDGSALGEWALVAVYGLRRGSEAGAPRQRVPLGSAPVSDGRYGPVTACLEADFVGLEVELVQGDNAVAVAYRDGTPAPGTTRLDIEYQAGFPRWLQAFEGASDQPVGNGQVRISWWDPGDRVVERSASFTAEGLALIVGLPAGRPLSIRYQAEGFETTHYGPLEIDPGLTGEPIVLRVDRLSGLELRAHLDDRPVPAFEAVVRPAVPNTYVSPRRVASDQGGTAKIEGLPPGSYLIDVLTPEGARRQGVTVSLPAPGPLTVDLEHPIEARGTLVAHSSGAPIVGARVFANRPTAADVLNPIELSLGTETDAAGLFRLGIGGLEGVELVVEAPGFGRQTIDLPSPSEGRVDLGTIRLQASQQAKFQLAGEFQGQTGFQGRSLSPIPGPWFPFDAQGRSEAIELMAGRPWIELRYPDGRLERHLLPHAAREADARLLEVCLEPRLLVSFLDEAGRPRSACGGITLSATGETGAVITRYYPLSPGRERLRAAGFPAGQIEFYLDPGDKDAGLIGTRQVARAGEQQLELRGAGAQIALLCVDLEGLPVPGVTGISRAARPSNQDIPVASSKTDSQGLMTLAVPEGEPYFVNLILAHGVWLPTLSGADIQRGESPYRVVVGGAASLEILATSQGQPLPGVFAYLRTRDGIHQLQNTRGNDQGRIEFTGLTTGAYRIELHTGKHLPIRAELNAEPADHWQRSGPIELSLHPYTPATLLFRDPSGQPLASTPVDLEHQPSGLPIQTAIDRGWLDDCPTTTDNQGRLIAPRLPLGTYRFRLAATEVLQGEFTLTGPDPLEVQARP